MDKTYLEIAKLWAFARQDGAILTVTLRTKTVKLIRHEHTVEIENDNEKVEVEI